MIQPSGLPGLREATTKPTTPRAAEYQTGDEPPLAFRLWCARRASGTSTTTRARMRPPATRAVTDNADPKRLDDVCAGPPLDSATLMGGTLRTDSSGNVTARPEMLAIRRPGSRAHVESARPGRAVRSA